VLSEAGRSMKFPVKAKKRSVLSRTWWNCAYKQRSNRYRTAGLPFRVLALAPCNSGGHYYSSHYNHKQCNCLGSKWDHVVLNCKQSWRHLPTVEMYDWSRSVMLHRMFQFWTWLPDHTAKWTVDRRAPKIGVDVSNCADVINLERRDISEVPTY
jgi:hypothetical protein